MSEAPAAAQEGHTDTAHSIEEIQKHVRVYLMVLGALTFLTIATVVVSYFNFHQREAIAIALAIATVKASLVAGYFMHLVSERKLIYWVLALCAVFFAALMLLPALTCFET